MDSGPDPVVWKSPVRCPLVPLVGKISRPEIVSFLPPELQQRHQYRLGPDSVKITNLLVDKEGYLKNIDVCCICTYL